MGPVLRRRSVLKALVGLPLFALPSWILPKSALRLAGLADHLSPGGEHSLIKVYESDFGQHRIVDARTTADPISERELIALIKDCWTRGGSPSVIECSDSTMRVLEEYW